MPPPDHPGRPAWKRCTGRTDEGAILNVRTGERGKKTTQRKLQRRKHKSPPLPKNHPRTRNSRNTEKAKHQIIISPPLRRNTRRLSPTPSWGGRGLGREDRECKDGHRKAEGRRSGQAVRRFGGLKGRSGRRKGSFTEDAEAEIGPVAPPGPAFWPAAAVGAASGLLPRRPAGARRLLPPTKRPPAPISEFAALLWPSVGVVEIG